MGSNTRNPRIVRFADYSLDLETAELRRNGDRIILQDQPFQIVTALLETPGQLVTREELINRLWPTGTFVDFDQSLNKAVGRLREAIGDNAENPRFVETLPRKGYRWLGTVERGPQGRLEVEVVLVVSSSVQKGFLPHKESVEMWERTLPLLGWHDLARVLKQADARGGPKFALEELTRACEEYANKHNDWMFVPSIAFTYTSLGNKDRAFAWLDKGIEQRSWIIVYLKSDNVWDPLHSDPKFKDLLRRVGLPQ